MAIDAHSTTAPADHRALLRTWTGAVPVPTPALTAETVAMLDAIPAEPLSPAQDAAQALHMRRALEGAPAPLPSLTAALSRRRAIFGGFALAAAPMAALPAVAQVRHGGAPISAEAAALQAEFNTLSERYDAVRKACREADARYVSPMPPERLFWQEEDRLHFGYIDPGRDAQSHRPWWGYPGDIDRLMALKLADLNGKPDLAARARGLEILDLQERYRAAVEAAEDGVGITAASEAWDVDATAYFDFMERLVALRTADPAVMRLKARVIAADLARHKGLDDYLANEIKDNPGEVETLALSLVRDMVAGLGLAT